jgi:hypothetical protein
MKTIREVLWCQMMSFIPFTTGGKWSGAISLKRDLMGYSRAKSTMGPLNISILSHVRAIQGPHFHMNLIRVGTVELGGWFNAEEEMVIDGALQVVRNIFAAADLGIGRVRHYHIPLHQAGEYAVIETSDEAEDLACEGWGVDDDALDVFIVRQAWSGEKGPDDGRAPVGGPCEKADAKGMAGAVIALDGNAAIMGKNMIPDVGRTLAHEIGHYFGLGHADTHSNLMTPGVTGADLTPFQVTVLREHCFVRKGC